MARYYFRPWKDDTLIAALHFMRCQIVRDNGEGLSHVDALLRLRGVDPETLPIPDKRPKAFKRSGLRQRVLAELRDGPLTGAELARRVRGNGLDYAAAYKRVYACLQKMTVAGLVVKDGRTWRLVKG